MKLICASKIQRRVTNSRIPRTRTRSATQSRRSPTVSPTLSLLCGSNKVFARWVSSNQSKYSPCLRFAKVIPGGYLLTIYTFCRYVFVSLIPLWILDWVVDYAILINTSLTYTLHAPALALPPTIDTSSRCRDHATAHLNLLTIKDEPFHVVASISPISHRKSSVGFTTFSTSYPSSNPLIYVVV